MRKKMTSIMLALALASAIAMPAAAAEPDTGTSETTLPGGDISDGVLIEGEILDEEEYLEDWNGAAARTFDVTYDDADLSGIVDSSGKYNGYDVMWANDAAEYCIDLMRKHTVKTTESFLVAVPYSVSELGSSSPYTYAFNVYNDEFADAFSDSLYVTGDGGDYLLYSMYGRPFYVTSSCKNFTSADSGVALVWATPGSATYYTSESQEKTFVTQAQSVVSALKKQVGDNATDYEKTCAVYDWIVQNVEYDYDNLGTGDYYIMYTAYGALVDGKAVCQGYANLFYYLLNELGVPCRIVAGTGYTGSASGPHAWNIVKLDGTWYHVDPTWGASYAQWYSGRYFFLQSEANFVNGINNTGHEMDYMTGIQYIDYTSEEFLSAHPISATADYCDHSYSLAKSREASCGVYGYEVYVCSKCGETKEETLDKLDHDYETITAATCTAAGIARCKNCGDDLPVGPSGHDYQYAKTIEPTCTKDGYDLYVCSKCGALYETDFTDSYGGHTYSEVVSENATHDDNGYERFTCSKCGDQYTVTIPKIAYHVYGNGYVKAEYEEAAGTATCGYDYTATCDICGETGYVLSTLHDFVEIGDDETGDGGYGDVADADAEDMERYFSCKYCGIVVIAIGDTDEYEAVLDEEGEPYVRTPDTDPENCEHDTYEEIAEKGATCIHPGHATLFRCTACGAIKDADSDLFTAPTDHAWSEKAVAAGCETDGYFEAYCANCGEVVMSSIEVVPAYGHTAVRTDGYAPTCTAPGLTDETYCASCGAVLQEAETIPEAGHEITEIEALAPTCTEGGRTEGWYCASCGEVFEESVDIPANAHTWHTERREASKTCTTNGTKALIVCSACGETDPEADGSVIPAGHDLVHMEYKAPTEYEDGNIECWYCYGCDTFFLDEGATTEVAFADTVLTYDPDGGAEGDGTPKSASVPSGTGMTGGTSAANGPYVSGTAVTGSVSDVAVPSGGADDTASVRSGYPTWLFVMIAATVVVLGVVVAYYTARRANEGSGKDKKA